MTFLDLAEKVLRDSARSMPVTEIWDYAVERDWQTELESQGKTPNMSLAAQLYVNARDHPDGKFRVIGSRPKRFYLSDLTYPNEEFDETDAEAAETKVKETAKYLEKDLHPVLAYFVNYHMQAYAKTLNHSTSKKKEFGQWVHPDMVACGYPFEEWKQSVFELSSKLGDTSVSFYSFELKRSLSLGNLRESFFQAVSNSSWAHEGFLVAAEISNDKEFMSELGRLSQSFGIGVIELDLEDPDATRILFPADGEDYLDWETINKMTINNDFNQFLDRVRKDIEIKEVIKDGYDPVPSREELIKKFQKTR